VHALIWLGDAVFVFHGVFVLIAVPSALLALTGVYARYSFLWGLHNLSIVIMVVGQLTLQQCPLVALESAFRHAGGGEMPYTGSYIRYVVQQLSGYTLPQGSVMAMSSAVALISIVALFMHWPLRKEAVAIEA
jgi:hypothetical protein